jgi:phosphoglycerate dehydrogenase-like enzyme
MEVHIKSLPDMDALALLRPMLSESIRLTVGPIPEDATFAILVEGFPLEGDLAASASLRSLVVPWSGVSGKVRKRLQAFPDVSVHNIHHNAQPVAEMAMGLLLAVSRRFLPFDASLRKGDWRPRFTEHNDALLLAGRRALVLGYGEIGQRVARLCRAFGMDVTAVRRSGEETLSDGIKVVSQAVLPSCWSGADVLFICLPLTPETEGLVDEDALSLLPVGSMLINVARAAIVDEKALYKALESGHLYGAGLDVWYRYPRSEEERGETMPWTYPFGSLPNVVLSPHRGDHCDRNEQMRMEALAGLLNAAAMGQDMPNRVSLARGY